MSNESGSRVAKPCGSWTWKKSSGSPPVPLFARVALTFARICASCAAPAAVVESGWLLNVAHVLYSAAVIGWFTPFTASFVISVGKVPRPKGVLPVLLKRKFGWLKALIRSTRKLIRRPSLPANGQPKSFESEKSKNSWRGERMSRERGALPNCPLTGRMKAAGLMKGSQPEGGAELPTGQARLHSGFLKGTPGPMSGLTT